MIVTLLSMAPQGVPQTPETLVHWLAMLAVGAWTCAASILWIYADRGAPQDAEQD